MAEPKTALVLSGGGSRGAFQAGAWEGLQEAGFEPDMIVGTSVGALTGALIAAGMPTSQLRHWWSSLRKRDVLRARLDLWNLKKWPSIYEPSPLRKLLETHLDIEAVRASKIPLMVTAIDAESGEAVVFHGHDLRVEHLLASMALPPGLPPVEVDGRLYIDGGPADNPPLDVALAAGARNIVSVLHDPVLPHAAPAPTSPQDAAWRASDVHWHGKLRLTLESLRLRRGLPKSHAAALPGLSLRIVAPQEPLGMAMLSFDPVKQEEAYVLGLEEARRVMASDHRDV